MRKLLSTAAGAALLFAAAPAALHAQWKTETYALKGGWNAIWLHGDATHATPAELFAAYPDVLEIWRWNPNPDQIQFTDSPSSPDATSAEWTIWNREDPEEQTLSALLGQSAYLIRCNGASTTTINVSIPQRPRPPSASVVPAPSTTSTTDHAEVFRRAFWRQPTSTDRILQAERRVNPEDDSWQWFIQLHPSPELLAALRDPDNLGLLALPPGIIPDPWPAAPAWLPSHDSPDTTGFEIRQSPATALTVLYRASDNLLFATDHGTGFAPPAR